MVALRSLPPCDYSYLSTLYFQNSNGFFFLSYFRNVKNKRKLQETVETVPPSKNRGSIHSKNRNRVSVGT